MLTPAIIERIFEAASMQRWNDHPRPVVFTELDKQAHKMVIAWTLARFDEDATGQPVNWKRLIEGGLFEFFQRVVLTDIKPPVYHKLARTKGAELNRWVSGILEGDFAAIVDRTPGETQTFHERFSAWFVPPRADAQPGRERRILNAAHYLATQWEFRIIYNFYPLLHGIERTRDDIEQQVELYSDLAGVQKLVLNKKHAAFVDLCGQLRFQQRWAQSPRIPATSVLGHTLCVAIMGYLLSLEIGACPRRAVNNFLGALFHDLPEVLTRDIISPVKRSVQALDEIIKDIEHEQMAERLLPLLPAAWHRDLQYFTENEFTDRIRVAEMAPRSLKPDEIHDYNEDRFDPVDGRMLKIVDHLAAMVEASLSIQHGVTSRQLRSGIANLLEIEGQKVLYGLDFGALFREYAALAHVTGSGSGTGAEAGA